jgi:oxygen-independent coproporphyrinogen-3 oxidase
MQSYEITKTAVDEIRARGVHSLNADILYGLPYQTKARITESVQKLLSLEPDAWRFTAMRMCPGWPSASR